MSGDRTLGVIGTLVWDQIRVWAGDDPPFEDWGGIAYSLCALSALLPRGWRARPIVKVGADMADDARAFMGGLARVDSAPLIVVPEANNRVFIDYTDAARRVEHLTGGVPPWEPDEIAAVVADCDALFVNFISGHEMGLEAALKLRSVFSGPIYTDLHSLFLGTDHRGARFPRTLESAEAWLRSADVIQVNEDELFLLTGTDEPWASVEGLRDGPGLILVTLGERGAAYVASSGFEPDPARWSGSRQRVRSGRRSRAEVTLGVSRTSGDPTGCGDVWGAAMFAALLGGATVEVGMAEANRVASSNVSWRGTSGLARRLAEHGTRAVESSDWISSSEVRS